MRASHAEKHLASARGGEADLSDDRNLRGLSPQSLCQGCLGGDGLTRQSVVNPVVDEGEDLGLIVIAAMVGAGFP